MVKQLNINVIVLLLLHLVWEKEKIVNYVKVQVIIFFLLDHFFNVHDVVFVVINNIMMMENLFNSVKVKIIRKKNKKIHNLFLKIVLVYGSSPAKGLLVMCNNENEQKQWITKLRKKILRPQNSQDDLLR